MIKNEPDKYANGANSNRSTNTTSKYQEQMNRKKKTVPAIIDGIRRSNFHDHNMLIYPDLLTFKKFIQNVQNKRFAMMKSYFSLPHMIRLTK